MLVLVSLKSSKTLHETEPTEVERKHNEQFLYSASELICCRICHEAEFETCKSLETPCSCSGTVKFAHIDCVQRWCDEKGNTNCEICLQRLISSDEVAEATEAEEEEQVDDGGSPAVTLISAGSGVGSGADSVESGCDDI